VRDLDAVVVVVVLVLVVVVLVFVVHICNQGIYLLKSKDDCYDYDLVDYI